MLAGMGSPPGHQVFSQKPVTFRSASGPLSPFAGDMHARRAPPHTGRCVHARTARWRPRVGGARGGLERVCWRVWAARQGTKCFRKNQSHSEMPADRSRHSGDMHARRARHTGALSTRTHGGGHVRVGWGGGLERVCWRVWAACQGTKCFRKTSRIRSHAEKLPYLYPEIGAIRCTGWFAVEGIGPTIPSSRHQRLPLRDIDPYSSLSE